MVRSKKEWLTNLQQKARVIGTTGAVKSCHYSGETFEVKAFSGND